VTLELGFGNQDFARQGEKGIHSEATVISECTFLDLFLEGLILQTNIAKSPVLGHMPIVTCPLWASLGGGSSWKEGAVLTHNLSFPF
jgi:hypothetical protein